VVAKRGGAAVAVFWVDRAGSLQLLEDLRQDVGDIDLWVAVMATVSAVNVRQLPMSWVLVHPPDQLTLRRALVVVVLDLLKRPVDHHPKFKPAAAVEDDALAAEDQG
jgi:hypothetical protein